VSALRWDDIPVFLAVVRSGTLSGAAEQLGVNHSTAWRRLKALEEALGAPLFERTPQGYALTAVGEAMLGPAERVEEEVFALQRAVQGTDEAPRGVVTVTAPESMLSLLTPMVVTFRQRHPGIVLDLQMGDRFYDLDRREADVAIRPGPEPPANAVGRRVAAVAWTVYGPSTVPLQDCDDLPWVGYSDALARLAAVRWRRARGGDPIVTVNTVPSMGCLLGRGNARGMLPCFVGDGDPLLQRLQPPIPEAASALWLLIHADLRRNARVRLFVDHAWAALRELQGVFEGT
jgi:molybdate transport repressor ModE-like protein